MHRHRLFARLEKLVPAHAVRRSRRCLALDKIENAPLRSCVRQIEFHMKQETVELGLGQGKRTLVLDWVLGGHDHERIGQGMGDPGGGHLALSHGFEQGRLHFGRGAVDFIDQDKRMEHRPLDEFESRPFRA